LDDSFSGDLRFKNFDIIEMPEHISDELIDLAIRQSYSNPLIVINNILGAS
jgi:hypothetical protein